MLTDSSKLPPNTSEKKHDLPPDPGQRWPCLNKTLTNLSSDPRETPHLGTGFTELLDLGYVSAEKRLSVLAHPELPRYRQSGQS